MQYLQKLLDHPDVYLVSLPQKSKSVYVDVFVKTGRLHEPNALVGIGHLMDHYINGSLYTKYLDRLNTNAWISQEHLHFHLSSSLSTALKDAQRFFDGVFRPRFTNEELFLFERQSIINEMKTDYATISTRQFQLVATHRFSAGSPFGRPTYQEADNVTRLSLNDLEHHHRQHFVRGNVVIFIAAHKPPRQLANNLFHLLKSYDLPAGDSSAYPINRYSGFKVVYDPEKDVAGQQYVSLSFPGLSYEDGVKERIALNMFCRIFTGLSRHSVFSGLRRAGIYAIDYNNLYYCHFGLVAFWATIPPQRLEQFLDVLSTAISRFKQKPLSRTFLNERLSGVRERTRNAWRNNNDLYNWLMEYILDEGEVRTPKEVFASLKEITPAFVQHLVGQILDRRKANIIVSGERPQTPESQLAKKVIF